MRGAKEIVKSALIGLAIVACLNALYLAFLTACFSVPIGERARANLEASMPVFVSETHDPPVFYEKNILATAYEADLLWIDTAVMRAGRPWYNAIALPHKVATNVEMTDLESHFYGMMVSVMYYYDAEETAEETYSRFWMLMVGVLRILFQLMKWNEIQYFFYALVLLLILYDAWGLAKKCGWRGLVPFGFAVLMRNLALHAVSFTTSTDSLLAVLSMAIVLTCADSPRFQKVRGYYYLGLGSMSFAIGTMESPALAQGMTLVTDLLLANEREKARTLTRAENRRAFADTLLISVYWALGYVATVLCKGAIARTALGDTGGGDEMIGHYMSAPGGIGERFYRIFYCLHKLFSPLPVKVPMMIAAVVVLLIMMRKRGVRKLPYLWQILLVTLYPCAWAFIVAEHSIHGYAANVFAVFVFGALVILCGLVGEGQNEAGVSDHGI